MKYLTPEYTNKFKCIADKCINTCCQGWEIAIDEESLTNYLNYGKAKNAFSNRLINSINLAECTFYQDDNKRCVFLNENNLCDMYIEAGKNMLCDTCKTYPRHIEEFEEVRETSLCMSCPEVARIILEEIKPVKFKSHEDDIIEFYEDFDVQLYEELVLARNNIIKLLQNRNISIEERMLKAYHYTHTLQNIIDNTDVETAENYGLSAISIDINPADEMKNKYNAIIDNIYTPYIDGIEILDNNWLEQVKHSQSIAKSLSKKEYLNITSSFINTYSQWEIQMEQIFIYWIFTYFCGGIYERDIIGKLQLAVASTTLVINMAITTFIKNNNNFSIKDMINICYTYSREIEHSDKNLIYIQEFEFESLK